MTGTGVAGERLRVHRRGPVTAVVGTHTRRLRPTEPNLRRYDDVMQRLSAVFPAVLPVRFGAYLEADELDAVLDARRRSILTALARVRHYAQMTVRLRILKGRPNTDAGHPPETGAEYLRARAAEQRAHEIDPLRTSIAKWIRQERVERRGGLATVYHLVPRRSTGRYRTALETAAEAHGVRLIVSGPWAPYAFAQW